MRGTGSAVLIAMTAGAIDRPPEADGVGTFSVQSADAARFRSRWPNPMEATGSGRRLRSGDRRVGEATA